jgi:hypothetical protein
MNFSVPARICVWLEPPEPPLTHCGSQRGHDPSVVSEGEAVGR